MILSLIALILITCAVTIGFYAACQFENADDFDKAPKMIKQSWPVDEDSKMIFWWVRRYLGVHVNYFYSKPLYSCIICMGSVHSIAPLWLWLMINNLHPLWFVVLWPIVALSVAGINKLVSVWMDRN